ncbi:hypothetical protein KCU77_g6478, partial [Aureobasidium melanogenum]
MSSQGSGAGSRQPNARAGNRRATARINSLRTRVGLLRDEIADLKRENVDLQDEIKRQAEFHQGASEGYTKLNNQKLLLLTQKEIARLQSENQSWTLRRNTDKPQKKKDEICRLEKENRKLQDENTRNMQEKDGEIQRVHKVANAALRERDSEVEALRRELAKMQKRDDEIKRLQKELIKYKGSMAASNYTAGQMSDTTIRQKFSELFYALRDWALDLSRQDQLDIQPAVAEDAEMLHRQVPCFKDGTSKQKMHALIATFSHVLVHVMKSKYVFGYAPNGRIKAANRLAHHLEDIPGATRQRKKQWVTLTNSILSKDKERSQQTSDNTLAGFVGAVETTLRQVFGFSFQSKDMLELKTVIEPYMPAIFALYLQEADYFISMLPATAVENKELTPQIFNADMMEDLSGEDEGFLQASYFPLICKETIKDDGKVERVVVCKAKVKIAP